MRPLRRLAPAIGLFFLSPLVGEFLLGNLSVSQLVAVIFLAPMYGGGALLVREITRRAGRGWPTMLVLALAYAVVEEGLVTQTLFNPSYFGHDLLRPAAVPWLGIGVWWTLFVLTLHVVWSVGVAVALVEALVPSRGTTPWLGRPGLAVVAVLFVLGSALNFVGTYATERFLASPAQLLTTVVVIAVLAWLAFVVGRHQAGPLAGSPPGPWLVGGFTLVVSSAFLTSTLVLPSGWITVAVYLALYVLAIVTLLGWSRRAEWGAEHLVAAAGGALLTYAWYGFPSTPILGATGTVDLVGNAVFAAAAVVLLVIGCLRVRGTGAGQDPAATPLPSPR